MWSDRYNYYNIQSDKFFTQKVDTKTVCEILLMTNCFKQTNHQSFVSKDNFPWVDIILVETSDGSFASSEIEIPFVNLIAIVTSKGRNIDQEVYQSMFKDIAKKLNWKLYLEQDDNENENIEIL